MQKLKLFLQTKPLFILLFPIFIVLHIEAQFGNLYTYKLMYKSILFLFIVPLIFTTFFFFFNKNLIKASLIAFFISVVIFYLSDFKYYLLLHFPSSFFNKYTFLLPVIFVLGTALVININKSKNTFLTLVKYLNIIFFLFIVFDFVQILNKKNSTKNSIAFDIDCANCKKPNIYYIVLDGYSSNSILQKEFNFNNNNIDEYLKTNNFKVLSEAKSNYNITPYSIGSTFNMNYNSNINGDVFLLQDFTKGVRQLYDIALFPSYSKFGYTINNYSFFEFKNIKKLAPIFDVFSMENLFLKHNLFYQMYFDLDFHFVDNLLKIKEKRNEIIKDKDKLNPTLFNLFKQNLEKNNSQPTFNYLHYYTPHLPYTRDSLGNSIVYNDTVPEAIQYINQVKYTNQLIKSTINFINKNDGNEKIIILQADHGFRFDKQDKYKDEFPNFSAIYFTRQNLLDSIPNDLNNVNTFRYINNLFFNANNSILENKQFSLKYKTANLH